MISTVLNLIHRFSAIPIEIPASSRQDNSKIYMETRRIQDRKNSLKENEVGGPSASLQAAVCGGSALTLGGQTQQRGTEWPACGQPTERLSQLDGERQGLLDRPVGRPVVSMGDTEPRPPFHWVHKVHTMWMANYTQTLTPSSLKQTSKAACRTTKQPDDRQTGHGQHRPRKQTRTGRTHPHLKYLLFERHG